MRVALAIPHKPGAGRDESLTGILAALGVTPGPIPTARGRSTEVLVKVFDDLAPCRVWGRAMWEWGAKSRTDFFLTLTDDVALHPQFWEVLEAMLPALPERAILAPSGQDARISPDCAPWATTHDFPIVGWAYGVRAEGVRSLHAFDMAGSVSGHQTEDGLVNDWAWREHRPAWHPVPTPVQHRDLPSTYGNVVKQAACDWTRMPKADVTSPAYWRSRGPRDLPARPAAPAVHHAHNVMGSPNYGGSPPAPYTR